MSKYSVLLVDHDSRIQEAVETAFEGSQHFEYLGCVMGRTYIEQRVIQEKPDLALVDVIMPPAPVPGQPTKRVIDKTEGIWTIRRISEISPSTKIIAFSNYFFTDVNLMRNVMAAGAIAAQPKDLGADDEVDDWSEWFCEQILSVAENRWEPSEAMRRLARTYRLAPRLVQVLQMLADGGYTLSIAEQLGLAEETVKLYRSQILSALGTSEMDEAIAIARHHGLIE